MQHNLDSAVGAAKQSDVAPDEPSFREMADVAAAAFRSGPRGAVLQAPVDDGRATTRIAPSVDWLLGMCEDRALGEIANARVKGTPGVNNVTLEFGTVRHLPFPDKEFAGVYSQGHLSHLRAPEKALKEMIRVCAPGGHIFADFLAPRDATRRGLVSTKDGFFIDEKTKTLYRYHEQMGLEDVLRDAGASKLWHTLKEKVWMNTAALPADDVLEHRHSWLIHIRVEST